MLRVVLIALSLGLLGLALAGCDNEYTAYDEAKAANTVESYRGFLEAYPDGVNVSEARTRLDDLEWEAAKATNTSAGFEEYLANHPDGAHATEAELEAPKLAWQESDAIGDKAAVQAFLAKYESSAYAKKAKDRIALLERIPQHLEIGETRLEEQDPGKRWIVSADVKNVGTADVVHANFRVAWMDAEGHIARTKRWLLVVEEKEGIDAPKELTKPLKPGETRTFSFDFRKSEAPDSWAGDVAHTRLDLIELKVAGE